MIDIAEEEYDGRLPRRINFILDEFGNLAEINNMQGKITAGRSRNIRWLIVCQNMEQLNLLYGDKGASIIFGNCANIVYLYSTDIKLLQRISAMCGLYSDELTGARHPLMSMDHLRYLNKDKGEVLLLLERARPFVGYLPDISAYPLSPTQHVNVSERKRQTLTPIDFQEIVNKQKREQMAEKRAEDERNEPVIPPEDIDKMIAEIDRKIAELEEEEREEKKRAQIHKKSNSKGKKANSRNNKHELKDDDSGDEKS